jgi:hypothetical protein
MSCICTLNEIKTEIPFFLHEHLAQLTGISFLKKQSKKLDEKKKSKKVT